MNRRRKMGRLVVLVVCIFILFGFSWWFGAEQQGLSVFWKSLTAFDKSNQAEQVIRNIRLPRVLGAFVVGSSFGLSGALMQGVTRNPIADSGLLGINSGASLAMALLFAFFPQAPNVVILGGSFLGSLCITFLVFGFLKMAGSGLDPVHLILAGVSISTFFTAISQSLTQLFNLQQDLSFWFVGGAANIRWEQLEWAVPVYLAASATAFALARQISLVSLSDSHAISLGGHPQQTRFLSFLIVAVLASIAVSLVGPVAFIGLMVPQIARGIIGSDYHYLLPASFVLGGGLVMVADLIARVVNPPFETPFGVVISLIGVPFLLVQVRRRVG